MNRFLKTVMCSTIVLVAVVIIAFLRFLGTDTDVKATEAPKPTLAPEVTVMPTPVPTPTPTPAPISVNILGTEYLFEAERIDLSEMTSEQIPEVLEACRQLTGPKEISVADANGESKITLKELKMLVDMFPEASYDYTITFYDQTFTPSTELVYYQNVDMNESDLDEIRDILGVMNKCDRFILDNCGFSDKTMASLRDEFRDRVKVVWRVYCGEWYDCLSDTNVIWSGTGAFNDSYTEKFRYLEDLKYVDIGHHQSVTSMDWVTSCPKIEVIIMAECMKVKDISAFATLKNLWYLEAYSCTGISDISPLAECTELEHLNLGDNGNITDLSPLFGLNKLRRVRFLNCSQFTDVQRAQLREILPHAVCDFGYGYSYWGTWRWGDDWFNEPDPCYLYLRKIFNYDENGQFYFDDVENPKPDYGDFYEREIQAYIAWGLYN